MKTKITMTIFLGLLMFSSDTFAETDLNKIIGKKEEENLSTKNERRRKKVQMCSECGKPEPICECEGDEHGDKDTKH